MRGENKEENIKNEVRLSFKVCFQFDSYICTLQIKSLAVVSFTSHSVGPWNYSSLIALQNVASNT